MVREDAVAGLADPVLRTLTDTARTGTWEVRGVPMRGRGVACAFLSPREPSMSIGTTCKTAKRMCRFAGGRLADHIATDGLAWMMTGMHPFCIASTSRKPHPPPVGARQKTLVRISCSERGGEVEVGEAKRGASVVEKHSLEREAAARGGV